MQVKKQQLLELDMELDMEQQTGSKLGKEYIKAAYSHSAYLTYMKCLDEAQAGIQIARRNIKHLRSADTTTLIA